MNLRSNVMFVFSTHSIIHLPHTWTNFAYNRYYRSNNHALRRDLVSHSWAASGLRNIVVEVFVDPREDPARYARRRTQRIGASDGQRILGDGESLSERARGRVQY